MDVQRFDALSRSVARAISRRQAVARLGVGGLAAGLVAASGRGATRAARPASQEATPTDVTRCGDECIDLSSDPDNCGECGNVCFTQVPMDCVDGRCTVITPCLFPEVHCGEDDECTDLSSDSSNCGACGNVCSEAAADVVCVSGVCTVRPPCLFPEVHCGEDDECTDLSSDPSNCGTCGNVCSEEVDMDCVNGRCTVPSQPIAPS